MDFELGTDYFETFEAGRDSHVIISWDYFSDRYKPLYFKSEDSANQYFKESICDLCVFRESPLEIAPCIQCRHYAS